MQGNVRLYHFIFALVGGGRGGVCKFAEIMTFM